MKISVSRFLIVIGFMALMSSSCKKSENQTPTPPPPPSGGGGFSTNAVVPITSSTVRQCFTGMKMRGVHPRLLFSQTDLTNIKNTANADAFAKPTYDQIISRANAILNLPLLSYGLDGANLRIPSIHEFCNDQVPFLVLAYQFTKDTRYALRCWQQWAVMCNYPDWGANRHFLDAGIAAKGVAITYDGLFDYLSDAQKQTLSSTVRNLVLQPGRTQIETNTGAWKWYLSDDNWNGICHGGMILASLATYETDSVFHSNVISLATNGLQSYMQSLEPDGASEEGMVYWSYGLSNTFLAFEALKRCLSTTYGLAERPGFRKTGNFPYLMSGPAGTASIGDDYVYGGKANKVLSYFWFSKYFSDANMARAHYQSCLQVNSSRTTKMNGWTDLLFYSPTLVNSGSTTALPTQGLIRGIDYMYALEPSSNEEGLYIGMHGGDNKAAHGHLDAGSFFIQSGGENFATGNLGREDPYPGDYFTTTNPMYQSPATNTATTPGRFYYYRIRTEGKNCMVFNPDARPEQNPTGASTVDKQVSDAGGAYYILNLQGIYNRDVASYKRGIKLNRSQGIISIQDEFTPSTPNTTAYWIMHSAATDGCAISGDGKMATMTKNGKVLYAVIKSPANAQFQLVNRNESAINYLTETQPIFGTSMNGKNSINKWYGKLQIKLTGLNAATSIRVDFIKSQSTSTPPVSNLSDWTTTN